MKKMNFDQFKETIISEISNYLSPKYNNCQVRLVTQLKVNQEIEYIEITTDDTKKVSMYPRINVHILYNNYIKHGLIETLKVSEQSLQDTLKNASKMQPLIDVENAVNQIVFSFIHYEQNKELLKNAVHRKWHDLAIVYNWFIDKEAGYFTQIIDDSAEKLGLSEEDLFLAAARNTMRLFPPKVENLSNYIVSHNISDEPDEFDPSDLNPMYIITNEECSNGAIVVLYENLLHELAEKLESDLYLLPSSVNEMIAVPAPDDLEKYAEMVSEINHSQVPLEEQLSNQIYYYNRETRDVTMATDLPFNGFTSALTVNL